MYLKKLQIGNLELQNNLILAPMAGVTNLPFRMICEKFCPGLYRDGKCKGNVL